LLMKGISTTSKTTGKQEKTTSEWTPSTARGGFMRELHRRPLEEKRTPDISDAVKKKIERQKAEARTTRPETVIRTDGTKWN